MTADTIARLTAILALNPADTAACSELRAAKLRGGLFSAPPTALRMVTERNLNDADLLPGWDWWLAQIDGGEGGEAWFAAPDAKTAMVWAKAWTAQGSWDVVRGTAEVRVCPILRDEDGAIDGRPSADWHQEETRDVRVGYGWDE